MRHHEMEDEDEVDVKAHGNPIKGHLKEQKSLGTGANGINSNFK